MVQYPDDKGNGWKEWSKYVLKELDRLNVNCVEYEKRQRETLVDIAMLKVKAGVWGLIGGMVPVLISLAVMYLRKG